MNNEHKIAMQKGKPSVSTPDICSSLFRFIWFFCRKRYAAVVGLLLLGALWAVHFCLSPVFVKAIIDTVASSLEKGVTSDFLWPFTGYLALALLILGISVWYDYLVMKLFPPMRAEIVETLQSRLLAYPYPFFQRHLSGSVANKISDISKGVITIITSFIDDFFSRVLLFMLGVATLYTVHPLFAAALLLWAILFFTLSYLFSKESLVKTALFSEARSVVMGKVVDALTNMFSIKIFGTRSYEERHLRHHLMGMKTEEQQLHRYLLRLKFAQGLSITSLTIFMLGLLFYTHAKGLISLGDFALVLTLTTGIVDETFFLALQLVQWTEEIGLAKQALSIFAEKSSQEKAPPSLLQISRGEIVFDQVTFFYTPLKPIFQNLSLKITPGSKVGIVGLSGSGKSTFAHLLLRLYDVVSGQVLIDGQDLSKVSQESIAAQIGMIPQDPSLFHRSVYDNILYGKLDASKEEVVAAAKKADCHNFISALPQGYDTLVGERGIKFSGGQRQRLAIARAFLKDGPILILDEATSALDSITEEDVQKRLAHLMLGRTTIVIAHRLSTLAAMDTLFVFEHGALIEQGSHADLLAKRGRYAALRSLQTGALFV